MLKHKKYLKNFLVIQAGLLAAILMVCPAPLLALDNTNIMVDQFISPDTCGECHTEIFKQWKNSMHNLAHKDSVYSRLANFFLKGLTDRGEIKEAESCVKCHTPVGNATGYPKKLSDDVSKIPEIALQGIQCDYCHSVKAVKQIFNNGLVLMPGHGEDDPGIKYGPFKDAVSDFHETQYSRLHTESEICGTCHNVKHLAFGTDLETTYTEWKNSPYNSNDPAKRITCQGCHMYQRPGIPATGSTKRPENPGTSTDDSVERPHIFTHYFVGGNLFVPGRFHAQEKVEMARERLENAAALSMDISLVKQKKLDITVTNTGAGHSIPTGVSDLRQVWLEVIIKDKNNKIQFQSGVINNKGELPENCVIFRTVFGDGNGKQVINIAKARQILSDNRIKAKQSVAEIFKLQRVPEKGSTITVRLLYRSLPRKILNLIPGKPFGSLPIIEMAKLKKQI